MVKATGQHHLMPAGILETVPLGAASRQ